MPVSCQKEQMSLTVKSGTVTNISFTEFVILDGIKIFLVGSIADVLKWRYFVLLTVDLPDINIEMNKDFVQFFLRIQPKGRRHFFFFQVRLQQGTSPLVRPPRVSGIHVFFDRHKLGSCCQSKLCHPDFCFDDKQEEPGTGLRYGVYTTIFSLQSCIW